MAVKHKNMIKHICGQCAQHFSSELAYLKHLCPAIGGTPRNLNKSESPKPKTASLFEKKILAAVQTARQTKRDYNA
jgi:hypothetical protein